jgi:hypothetical protein
LNESASRDKKCARVGLLENNDEGKFSRLSIVVQFENVSRIDIGLEFQTDPLCAYPVALPRLPVARMMTERLYVA